MALVLQLLAETGLTLSEQVAQLPSYAIFKDKHACEPAKLASLYAAIRKHWPEAKVNEEDGLRLDWPDRWLHVRSSNTEPIIRVIAEAPTAEDAKKLCQDVSRLLG